LLRCQLEVPKIQAVLLQLQRTSETLARYLSNQITNRGLFGGGSLNMTDEQQQEKEEQLTEKEKRLKKERRRRQANNGDVKGGAAQVKDKAETNKTDKHDGNVNSDRQPRPSDSDRSSNARKSKDEEIALIFRMANDKLDKIEANAEKEKQQVARETAQKLEKYRPKHRIASVVVKGFRGRISKSVIYAAPDETYKIKYRVQNARKRKNEKEKKQKTESSAPTSELKQIIIDTSGHSTQQLVGPDSSDDGDNNKPQQQTGITQNSKSVTINETHEVGSGVRTDASPPQPSNKYIEQECPSCLELQDEVIQLREALRRMSMQTADQVLATGFGFPIPKEKYEMVIAAMDRSKSAIFVECDESKKIVRVVADVDN
jgi:hypothetical protein